ncbi:MAG: serine hydrolase domain-containing protein [Rhizomicrobium sp.]
MGGVRCISLAGAVLAAALTAVSISPAQSDPAIAPPVLTKTDLDTWLDGFMPYALKSGGVAGAVIAVVKDGKVLTEKGFGYSDVAAQRPVDPQTTLFRPGSVSKLFTWTAVMQQVQAGRIDLDQDVNVYLDFKIPPYQGKPVTMREIMTHSAGFEEALGGLITSGSQVPSLGEVVKKWIPERIHAPGSTPSYSNYGAMLAGYIVQRVSGEPYDAYIQNHIFHPLGMMHSTMSEPLPANLAPLMSKGYSVPSSPPMPFAMVTFRPAGSATSTADDMARFMIAHLNEANNPLLDPATSREMHTTALTILPPLDRAELGFFESNLNGHRIIGHGGDLLAFHSDLWLIMDQNVGVFFSVNSAGRGATSITLRAALIANFMNRYFPTPKAAPSTFKPQAADAEAMTGTYLVSQHSESGPRAALNFFTQTSVSLDAQGHLQVPGFVFVGTDGAARDWVEVAPFVWKDRFGSERLAAQVVDGKVVRFSVDAVSPFQVFERAPWYKSTAWLQPALIVSLLLLLIAVLSLPFGWLVRRYYGTDRIVQRSERTAYLAQSWFALGSLVILGLWMSVLLTLTFNPLGSWVYVLEVATIVALPLLCAASVWLFWASVQARRGILALIWRGALVLASVCVLWFAVAFNLTHIGLDY